MPNAVVCLYGQGAYVGDAYERMFLNSAKGDGSLFVSSAELVEVS